MFRGPGRNQGSALSLPRIWKYVVSADKPDDGRQEPGVWPSGDKITTWWAHAAALLEELPLSQPCVALKEQYHILPEGVTLAQIRKLSGKLPTHPAHSFLYNGKWKSHSIEACLRSKKIFSPGETT